MNTFCTSNGVYTLYELIKCIVNMTKKNTHSHLPCHSDPIARKCINLCLPVNFSRYVEYWGSFRDSYLMHPARRPITISGTAIIEKSGRASMVSANFPPFSTTACATSATLLTYTLVKYLYEF